MQWNACPLPKHAFQVVHTTTEYHFPGFSRDTGHLIASTQIQVKYWTQKK